jgi:hypothetical protein
MLKNNMQQSMQIVLLSSSSKQPACMLQAHVGGAGGI